MTRKKGLQGGFALLVSTSLLLTGCTTALVRDDVKSPKTGAHCSGSQGVDDSSIAVLPVPVVAFVVPHANLHDIKADDYLKRCGDPTKLINQIDKPEGRGQAHRLYPSRTNPNHHPWHLAMVSSEHLLGSGREILTRHTAAYAAVHLSFTPATYLLSIARHEKGAIIATIPNIDLYPNRP